ncbi:MAG: hypothetical protein LLF84_07395 [Methanoregulaceae archaeon]|nr:hypothetical protein [Methanoregulaceae archaeon]
MGKKGCRPYSHYARLIDVTCTVIPFYPVRSRISTYSSMGKSRRKLFISATISGIALRLGLPGLADLISLAWNTTREPIEQITPSDLRIVLSVAGLLIFAVIMYLNWEIYLKGAKKGKMGIITVVAGVVLGFVIGSIIIGMLVDTFGV